jgi:hypothetical protein
VPPGAVIEAEAEHSYSTAQAGRIFEWLGSLSATYVAPKGNPVSVPSAVAAFRALALDRLDTLFKLQARGGGGIIGGTLAALSGVKFRPNIVPVSFSVSDPTIYGNKQVRIEMKYRVAGAPLALILNAGGLWRPAPGPDPKAWLTSISANIGPYGDAGLPLYIRGEEQIVDLCARIPADPPRGVIDTDLTTKRRPRVAELRGGPVGNLFPPPPAERSWITYMASVRVEVDSGVVVGQTLPDSSIADLTTAPPWNAANGLPTSAGDLFSPGQVRQSRGAGTTFAHRRTIPAVYVFLTGYAVRAGYQVAPPALVSAGGVPLALCNRPGHEFIEQSVVGQGGTDGSIPIYGCAWSQRYVAVGDRLPVGPMPVPPNPLVA